MFDLNCGIFLNKKFSDARKFSISSFHCKRKFNVITLTLTDIGVKTQTTV